MHPLSKLLLILFLLPICSGFKAGAKHTTPAASKYSDNIKKLNDLITFDLKLASARWEVFATPEDDFAPGPIDYLTLVAEIEPVASDWFGSAGRPTGSVGIFPESARPWMSEPFKKLLTAHVGKESELSKKYKCKEFSAILKKSGKIAPGFICQNNEKALVYLTVADYTGTDAAKGIPILK